MLISAFARQSGLPVDTVRFYVKRGLLRPEQGTKGGSRPYQIFSQADLDTARVVRVGQALGLSLTEIRAFIRDVGIEDFQEDGANASDLLAFLLTQRDRLRSRIADLEALEAYLDAKVAWLQNPRRKLPDFPDLTTAAAKP